MEGPHHSVVGRKGERRGISPPRCRSRAMFWLMAMWEEDIGPKGGGGYGSGATPQKREKEKELPCRRVAVLLRGGRVEEHKGKGRPVLRRGRKDGKGKLPMCWGGEEPFAERGEGQMGD